MAPAKSRDEIKEYEIKEPTISISLESPDQSDIQALLAASDAYAASLYPAESNHMTDVESLAAPNARFLVARQQGQSVGCCALILEDDQTAEIKRMWVEPKARGRGLSRQLLTDIEAEARNQSVHTVRLETGIAQPAAIGLYKSAGYVEIGPFGSYQPDPNSIFMEKRLEQFGAH